MILLLFRASLFAYPPLLVPTLVIGGLFLFAIVFGYTLRFVAIAWNYFASRHRDRG